MEKEYLLDLSTLHTRPKIRIDGLAYEMRVMDDFGLEELAFFQDVAKRLKKLDVKNISDNALVKLATTVDEAVQKIMIDLPAEVVKKLAFQQKGRIIEVFSVAVTLGEGPRGTEGAKNPPIGESTSPDLPDSTEAAPSSG